MSLFLSRLGSSSHPYQCLLPAALPAHPSPASTTVARQAPSLAVFKMFKKLLEKLLLDHDVTTVFFHSFRHCEMAQNNSLHPLPLFPNIPDWQKRKITVMILLLIIILVYY